MKLVKLIMVLIVVATLVLSLGLSTASAGTGFDKLGYNDTGRIYNGVADGVDGTLDSLVWGDSTYAKDKLVMKWNDEWDRGKAEGWSNGPYDAWTSNQWNGQVEGGSGEVWHYKIVWVGNYTAHPELVPEGGYGIWGQFATIMDHGTISQQGHEFLAKARPAGYGTYP